MWEGAEKVDASSGGGKLLKFSFDWEVKSVIRKKTAILKLFCSLLCPMV